MWAATGTAIAYAPALTELREPVAGGENIETNEHGHSARTVGLDNRFKHPTCAAGTFIALGCGGSLATRVMMWWWEGRKVERIEGPMVKVVRVERKSHRL